MDSRLQPLAEVYPERLQGSRRAGVTKNIYAGSIHPPHLYLLCSHSMLGNFLFKYRR